MGELTDSTAPHDHANASSPGSPGPEPIPVATARAIERLRAELAAAPNDAARSSRLAAFWRGIDRTPLVEPADAPGHSVVTFLWRDAPDDPATTVQLDLTSVTDEQAPTDAGRLERLDGTDLWHRSYRVRDDWRASYRFHPTRDEPVEPGERDEHDEHDEHDARDEWHERSDASAWRGLLDPVNPLTCRGRGAERSVAAMPEAPAQPWLARRDDIVARGRLDRLLGPDHRAVWVYDPRPRSAASTGLPLPEHPMHEHPGEPARMPLIVLFDGDDWPGPIDVATTLDNLVADRLIRPCLVVMPEAEDRGPSPTDSRATPHQTPAGADSSALDDGRECAWVVDALLPWVRAIAPASLTADEVVVAGQGIGAYAAMRCALEHPEAVGAVLSQSAALPGRELYAAAPDLVHRLHVYIEVGTQERALREPNRQLAAALVAAGADVHYAEYSGGHDVACWRGGIAEGIRALIGPPHAG